MKNPFKRKKVQYLAPVAQAPVVRPAPSEDALSGYQQLVHLSRVRDAVLANNNVTVFTGPAPGDRAIGAEANLPYPLSPGYLYRIRVLLDVVDAPEDWGDPT